MDINDIDKEDLQKIVNDYYDKKEKQKNYSKDYYAKNREWIREKIRKKQEENRTEVNRKALEYYHTNKERITELRKLNKNKVKINNVIITFD
jgi:FMN phosphatase YigB (HAD superfamily)